MQANRDRFQRKQLLQVLGEPDYDSPLLSASKTEQKRKASPVSAKDRSDKKRVKSVKKASSASKSKTIPQHKQCKRPGCVSQSRDFPHSCTYMLSASTKRIMRRVPLLRPVYWPRKRKTLLIINRTPTLPLSWNKNCVVCSGFKGSLYDFITAVTSVLCVLHIIMHLQFIRYACNIVTHFDTLILKWVSYNPTPDFSIFDSLIDPTIDPRP